MSMCRCETHDRHFDSDYHINCPDCQARGMVYCYYCDVGSQLTEEQFVTMMRGGDVPCPSCGEPRWANTYE